VNAPGVVVLGGGFAGATTAMALRTAGYTGPITIVGAEPDLPYNRPPLSKSFLKGGGDINDLHVRPASFWTDADVHVIVGNKATNIDRQNRSVTLEDGTVVGYEQLVLATGARTRRLDSLPNGLALRTWQDAISVREHLEPGQRIAVVGGGFIGLELAAAAAVAGAEVAIIEAAPRLLARALSPQTAGYLARRHQEHGVTVHVGRSVHDVGDDHVVLDDGTVVKADAVVVGVGVIPRIELAEQAGLDVGDGVWVDDSLRTSDPRIWAIGDVAWHPCSISGRRLRIESVQNATDQARHVAAQIVSGDLSAYRSVPWFWTEQYGQKILIAGVAEQEHESIVRGDVGARSFSVCRYDGDRLVAVESVDRMKDHVEARKILAGADPIGRGSVADVDRSLLA